MKIFNKIFIFILGAAVCSACLGDLDTQPLNETDFTSENAYESPSSYLNALAYINGYYMLVGQDDPGSNDLGFSDAGQSEFLRQWLNLNEMTCDAMKCVWGDSYLTDLQMDSWGAGTNDAMVAVYTRAVKAIALVNEFLLQTEDSKLEARGQSDLKPTVAGYRAEARFHRAMFFYILMDEFGNPPFPMPENIGGENPRRIERAELFQWLEEELLDLASDESAMPAKGAVPYPRPTKGSVWALLSRMYLNAEVYTGTARWQDTKDASKKVIDMGYGIHTPYSDLFRQDNTESGAAEEEFVFAVAYDRVNTQSWGGTTTLTSASLNEDANMAIGAVYGLSKINGENWAGYHVPADYVARFELNEVEWGNDENVFGYNRETSDKRAFFCNYKNEEAFDASSMASGWFCWKFNGMDSNNQLAQNESAAGQWKLSSTDMPIFRLAEMYLNYAEADARLNGGEVTDATAKGYVKELRDRAGVATPSAITLDWLLDERAREFMWEGHRRVDLIRYGYFTSMNYPWTLKGGILSGKVAIPSHMTIFPIIQSDLSANSNLKQNPGY
ncbi:MAG: RagB/SusD family nutrient uptake outer membrane protein [Candidatus Cryptobacteroides sp.]